MELSISQFAILANTTKRTLQYYRSIGIFLPYRVRSNGYVVYKVEQISTFSIINILVKLYGSDWLSKHLGDSLILDINENLKIKQKLEFLIHRLRLFIDSTTNTHSTNIRKIESREYFLLDKVYYYELLETCLKLSITYKISLDNMIIATRNVASKLTNKSEFSIFCKQEVKNKAYICFPRSNLKSLVVGTDIFELTSINAYLTLLKDNIKNNESKNTFIISFDSFNDSMTLSYSKFTLF